MDADRTLVLSQSEFIRLYPWPNQVFGVREMPGVQPLPSGIAHHCPQPVRRVWAGSRDSPRQRPADRTYQARSRSGISCRFRWVWFRLRRASIATTEARREPRSGGRVFLGRRRIDTVPGRTRPISLPAGTRGPFNVPLKATNWVRGTLRRASGRFPRDPAGRRGWCARRVILPCRLRAADWT